MDRMGEAAAMLSGIAVLSAIMESLLSNRRGGKIVCMMISLAGVLAIWQFVADSL